MIEGLSVHVQGAGKVGTLLARELRQVGWHAHVRAARRPIPRQVTADVVVFAIRDGQLEQYVQEWGQRCRMGRSTIVLHCSGSMGPEILAGLRDKCAGVGQWHPLVSVVASARRGVSTRAGAATGTRPTFRGAYALVAGDRKAIRAARGMCDALQMCAQRGDGIDVVAYHTAAAIMAAGTVVLSQAACDLLGAAGIPSKQATRLLAPLIRSVATNLHQLGLPGALSGPVRRGDEVTVQRHIRAISQYAPEQMPLYVQVGMQQVHMARALGETRPEQLERIVCQLQRALASMK